MITTKWMNITIGILSLILVALIVWGMVFPQQNNNSGNSQNNTQTQTTLPTPTLISVPTPTYPPIPDTPLGRIKRILLIPQKYQNITLEYKPRSDTIVIYYTGPQETAQNEFNQFLQSVKVTDSTIKTYYMSLDPISITVVPPANSQ